MKIAVYSSKPYDEATLTAANTAGHTLSFLTPRLEPATVALAKGCDAVCAFVNDQLNAEVLTELHGYGLRLIVMRCAGYNNVDLQSAKKLGLTVARVPEYSPFAVAEHTLGLMLCLNRKIHRAYNRVRERNFSLQGLLGFDLHGKTAGIVGTGKIGSQVCRIMLGFGCEVVAYDRYPNEEMKAIGVRYMPLEDMLKVSDVVSLHCPLTPKTHHIINAASIATMKHGAMLINTSRGGLLNTTDVIKALKSGKIGALGLDVYENEAELFFEDRSESELTDEVFARLLTFSNVLITGHQAFFTTEALDKIAAVTMENATEFQESGHVPQMHQVV